MTSSVLLSGLAAGAAAAQPAVQQGGGRAEMRPVETPHGARDYRLYLPAQGGDLARPLVVMLHGCTQDAADIARGTRLDEHAERLGIIVAYPEQPATANPQKCWSWFAPAHQARDGGEPAIIAAIVREVMASQRVDPERVYVAGISAGGAMAAIMGAAYPELFAAVAVHSGVARGAAISVPEALAVMAKGPSAPPAPIAGALPPLFVLHGARDAVLAVANAAALAAQWAGDGRVEDGDETGERGGYRYARRVIVGQGGRTVESWIVEELGHAWSGGSPAGSYTDAKGPDATALMLEFFLARRRTTR